MMTLRRELLTALGCVIVAGGVAYADTPAQPPPAQPAQPAPSATAPGTTAGDTSCEEEPPCPVAQAQPQPQPEPQPAPVTYEPAPSVTVEQQPSYGVPGGFSITGGGGVDDFAQSGMRGLTKIGGGWNVRATIGTKEYVALEGSYIGSAQTIESPLNEGGFNSNATLVGNGAQLAIRFNATRNIMAQPFLYGGAAWRHYNVTNRDSNFIQAGINNNDNVAEFPVGIGVSGHWGGFTADVRGEYRFVVDENLIVDPNDPGSFLGMNRWNVMGNLGYEL